MREIIDIPLDATLPPVDAVLKGQGIPDGITPDKRIIDLARDAISLYKEFAKPRGVRIVISIADFESIYFGEGHNEPETPLYNIYTSSSDLALFAVTIGDDICAEITRLFDTNDFALGAMLDSAASEGTEMAAQLLEDHYRKYLKDDNRLDLNSAVIRYSPGYCGWHISAQKKLFGFLKPEEIGIELGESYLMNPLKSISGVLISGAMDIFDFDTTFSFCRDCETLSCWDRLNENINQ
ncbi:MAG: hypothetical protein GY839_18720 [candidate division Zixibacteria bacterium]|nr:hypothetical protein [candidate division Zixibacteria bacterium]